LGTGRYERRTSSISNYWIIFLLTLHFISYMNSRSAPDIETQRYKEKCKMLLKLSPKIRFVSIINEFGRTLAGQLRKGTIPLFNVEEARNEFFIEATTTRLRRNFESSIGKMEFTLTVNEKVIILIIPTASANRMYYFTLDKRSSLQEISDIKETAKKLTAP
jgi:hypothetical protein